MSNIGDFLKELRGKRSLRKVEELSGVSHTYLSSLEKGADPRTGKERNPTPETLKKLAKVYDYPYLKLLEKAGYIPIDVPFVGYKEDLEKYIEEENNRFKEKVKNKDILQLLQNNEETLFINGYELKDDDRQRLIEGLKRIFPNYMKED